jgi:hypothetical protein
MFSLAYLRCRAPEEAQARIWGERATRAEVIVEEFRDHHLLALQQVLDREPLPRPRSSLEEVALASDFKCSGDIAKELSSALRQEAHVANPSMLCTATGQVRPTRAAGRMRG